MLTDKQSLLLCGLLAGGIFVGGLLDILDNFVVLTILTIAFLAVVLNIISAKYFVNANKDSQNSNLKKDLS